VTQALDRAIEARPDSNVTLTIETTAGQGTSLGWQFEQIGKIIELSQYPDKFGVCVDTCHIFAAGYDFTTKEGYAKTFDKFDELIGLQYLKMFHVNDSKKALLSRVDRHEHIGKGFIGLAGFSHLVNDPRFYQTPMILETPKGADGLEDIVNLATLDRLTNV
jgi:deoxyribonuclease-4